MTSERWHRVKELFEAALERGPAERAAFIAQACAGDEAIRQEVESLLAAHEGDSSFMNKPLGNLVVGDQPMLAAGQRFGQYEAISPLGEGGMGQVYLAVDTRLGRKVALKLLPSSFMHEEDRVLRFGQEARAASALNHPNIITIYEIGQVDGRHFIAAEYVAGETLHARLERERLEAGEALDIAVQVASALASAHKAGIVHRDIKPENIMLRDDGLVKVLDFGLAKLTANENFDLEAPTRAQVRTTPGTILGTVRYMSPEQARGKEIDSQTDIWSFGVVLYEMLACRLPFNGETSSDVLAAILKNEPVPLAAHVQELPKDLERIVSKALRKKREERYQDTTDLLIDLRDLKQELEFSAKLERTASPTKNERAITGQAPTKTEIQNAQTTSSAEYLITEIKRHKWSVATMFALLALAVAGIGLGLYRLLGQKQTALSFQTAKFARLTSTGKAVGAAISPDGKWLVHVIDDGGQQSLWLRQVAIPNSNTQIVSPAEVQYWGVAFSPDGNYVYYTAREKNAASGTLYQVPVLGGTARKLTTGINSSVAFSPDGKQIAFFAFFFGGEDKLMIANADGTGARQLAVRRGGEYFFWDEFSGVSWSPDGKTLASPVGNSGESYMSIATVSVASGEIKVFTPRRWWRVRQVAWLGDSSRLLLTTQEHVDGAYNIWQLSYPAGEAQKLTNDLNSYPNFSLTSDFNLLAAVETEQNSNIWVLPAFDVARSTEVTQSRNFVGWLSWAPDGKIVYSSNPSGSFDLYSLDARGGTPKQLTNNSGFDGEPCVSPDGRYVVFASNQAGTMHLWRMDIDGANAKQLTDKIDDEPNVSPDGRWVIYTSCTNKCAVWKVGIDGGQPVKITDKQIAGPTVSPDGKQIAGVYFEENAPLKFAILSFEDGQLIKTFDQPAGMPQLRLLWTADGRALVYAGTLGGVSNLWAQPVDGSPPEQLTNFTSDRIFGVDISRDGKQLALSRGTQASDVVLISDFK